MMLPKKGDAVIGLTGRKRLGGPRTIKAHGESFRFYAFDIETTLCVV